ncbi:hypothetical protein DVB69_01515 [Sporosarcina sp. BI001-red]|uniref:hypothetical protein n=1 Tax=Sporosarcina sp. BI001-red TaxID=2282866 RepID=UPI000E251DC2|nr:hypothetical protein [Sporosarcina sp. BI001-red]REB10980.1 hypothetical protein DVB69_01515 [Sporosarcina sp. BI001-red]
MNERLNRPKRFGEILDLTFTLCKNNFKSFFIISLLFMGPVYLLEALIKLLSGVNFFREVSVGGAWYENIAATFEVDETTSLGADIGVILLGIVSLFIFPVATAATLFVVDHIRKNEAYTIGSVVKKAFGRYGAILGSTLLFTLIVTGLILFPIMFIALVFIIGIATLPIVGIILGVLLFLAFAIVIGYLITRWSFYFGSAVLGEGTPGLSRSWRLSRKHGWKLVGLYIVFFLILSIISTAFELTFGLFLGNSVLLSMILSLVNIVTAIIFAVGFAVTYFDLKVRHDADDLKELIDEYTVVQS